MLQLHYFPKHLAVKVPLLAVLALIIAGCNANNTSGNLAVSETFKRGFILPDDGLEQVPIGSSQEQVLVVLGTPSTIATVDGDVFYYISQTARRQAAFLPPRVVDQRVLAVYFNNERRVERIADYGLQDGQVFDFISRTTPTSGADRNLLQQIFAIVGS